jgi:aspartate kinase
MRADPRIVPTARKLKDITYEEMLEMATQGSQVMHNRAVELASVYGLPVLVTSSMVEAPGTLIHGGEDMEERNRVRGIAHDTNVAKVTVRGVPDRPGIAAHIFEPLAEAGISVDTIVQNASEHALTDLTFTLGQKDLRAAEALMPAICETIGAAGFVANAGLGKVSIVGVGIQTAPGYAARMFRSLFDAGINIDLISTSEIRLTCLVARCTTRSSSKRSSSSPGQRLPPWYAAGNATPSVVHQRHPGWVLRSPGRLGG